MAVYQKYYHCRREPFSLSPDPSFLYGSATHREALSELRYLVQERKGFAVLTGEVGTGKTILLRSLIESFDSNVESVYVFNPPHSREALYAAIADELNISLSGHANPTIVLNHRFLEICEKGGTVVLIFDEAQSIQPSMLEEIRLLTNLETSSAKLVQVILAGQPEFNEVIDSTELRALRQRLVFRFNLVPLDADETAEYITARLETAGASSSPFTIKACGQVHDYSRGLPRLINVICDNAMLAAYAIDEPIIGNELIEEIAADLKLVKTPRHASHISAAGAHEERFALSSGRQLIFAVTISGLILAVSMVAAVAKSGHAGAEGSSLTQLQGWFSNALHWLDRGGRDLVHGSDLFRTLKVSL
jgi:general secretion pathway protein A